MQPDYTVRLQAVTRRNLYEEVHRRLREAILAGELPAGERVHESQLAQRLGVSRTPVRESVLKLEREGLVYRDSRSGFVIYPITKRDIADAYACRSAVDALVVSRVVEVATPAQLDSLEAALTATRGFLKQEDVRAVMRCNSEFHDLLVQIAGSHIFRTLHRQVWTFIERYRFAALALFSESPGSLERYLQLLHSVLQDHEALLAALRTRDAQRARTIAERHGEATAAGVMQCIATLDDYLQPVPSAGRPGESHYRGGIRT
ncbi:MAG: GntR family transcriptional regulator [Armatimonadota bacterium]|nr:GntR family transcriptional regulator [Armatimonadota bacterium]